MEAPIFSTDPRDLTGKVALVNFMPEFEGNYSMVLRGYVHGVSVIESAYLPRSARIYFVLGCSKSDQSHRRAQISPPSKSFVIHHELGH